MKKRQRETRLIRAGIQLAFFIAAPSLFSTAFAGIKSIFLAIAAGQPVEWNSFLTVTDMHVPSDPLETPFMKGFPGYGQNASTKKRNRLFLKRWFTDFRRLNISYWL